jgi:hypothetical protein
MGSPVVHRKRNFATKSIEEVAFDVMFRGFRCTSCGNPRPCIRIQMFCAIDDLPPVWKVAVERMKAAGELRTVNLKTSDPNKPKPGIRVGEAYACHSCKRELEIAAARAPSFYVVAIDRQEQTAGAQVQGGLILLPSHAGG